MDYALLIVGMAVVTFGVRYGIMVILRQWSMPSLGERILYFVPLAAFAAIIAPDLIARSGHIDVGLENPHLIAGIAAILVAAVSRSTVLTIVVGMTALWFVQALLAR